MKPELRDPENVLIIKPSSLGDVVSAVPVLSGLKRSFPRCRVSWLVTPGCADILTDQPGLDEIILFDRQRFGRMATDPRAALGFFRFCRQLRERRFDWVLDLQGLFRSGYLAWQTRAAVRVGFAGSREGSWLFYSHRIRCDAEHTIDRNIELVRAMGVDARAEDFRLKVDAVARQKMEALLAAQGIAGRKFVLVFPGTRWPSKTYPFRRWQDVVGRLSQHRPVVLAGGPQEQDMCHALTGPSVFNMAGKTNLRELAAMVELAGVVICGDSAASFISPAVGTPHLVLLGPTRPEKTGPYRDRGHVLRADLPCLACLRRECWHDTCMQTLTPVEVVAAACAILDAGRVEEKLAPAGRIPGFTA